MMTSYAEPTVMTLGRHRVGNRTPRYRDPDPDSNPDSLAMDLGRKIVSRRHDYRCWEFVILYQKYHMIDNLQVERIYDQLVREGEVSPRVTKDYTVYDHYLSGQQRRSMNLMEFNTLKQIRKDFQDQIKCTYDLNRALQTILLHRYTKMYGYGIIPFINALIDEAQREIHR